MSEENNLVDYPVGWGQKPAQSRPPSTTPQAQQADRRFSKEGMAEARREAWREKIRASGSFAKWWRALLAGSFIGIIVGLLSQSLFLGAVVGMIIAQISKKHLDTV